jgi:hypothetical protein
LIRIPNETYNFYSPGDQVFDPIRITCAIRHRHSDYSIQLFFLSFSLPVPSFSARNWKSAALSKVFGCWIGLFLKYLFSGPPGRSIRYHAPRLPTRLKRIFLFFEKILKISEIGTITPLPVFKREGVGGRA